LETSTPVCGSAEEVRDSLTDLRDRAEDEASQRGLRLVPTGTPVLAEAEDWPPISPGSRYREIADWFGAVAHTSNTCGCHVHVAIPDRAVGVEVSNRVRPWLPVLLALTANSPFNEGIDTAYHSWRYVLWSRWPTAGPPPLFVSLDHYESSVAALLRVGAVLDRRGVYWDIRLSERQPTLEFRVCDVIQTPTEAATIAALVRAAVATAMDDIDSAYRPALPLPQEVLRANLWRAAREGLAGACLHPVSGELTPVWQLVEDLVDWVRPALRAAGDADFVAEQLAWLRTAGDGATRQRAVFARRQSYSDVIDELAGRS
ncbi:MAG TPA: glutamate--cysteine ligase, partial [Pseudonocardiaceae bacterium]|nr:glutamate--cysteine ligase [Pseudonocardiaceae bacterium]